MKVSICVPTYNQAEFLPQALDSILEQEDCEFDIIVANDASTDDTAQILEQYKAKYPSIITIINQPENKGLVLNTRDCLLAADGDFIAILEGDDFWCHKHKLRMQAQILVDRPNVSMIHTGWTNYYQTNSHQPQPDSTCSFHPDDSQRYDLRPERDFGAESVGVIMSELYRPIRLSSCMIRRDTILDGIDKGILNFDTRYSTLDIPLFYTAAFFGKLAYCTEITTHYRILEDSVSHSKDPFKSARYGLGCFTIYVHFIKKCNIEKPYADCAIRRAFKTLFPFALQTADRQLADYLKQQADECGYSLRVGQRICFFGAKHKTFRSIARTIITFERKKLS